MKRLAIISLLTVAVSQTSYATTPLWFTDQPPDKAMMSALKHAHGGLVRIENAVYHKQLWLRKGDGLFKSTYVEPVAGVPMHIMDIEQKITEVSPEKQGEHSSVKFAMPAEGFYNAYYTERSVADNLLSVNTAKTEALKHNCREGHKYDRKLVNPNQWSDTPLEIVRLRLPEEDFHTRIQSGNELQFNVLFKGKPVSGALVKLETQKGWIKSTQTDDKGIARFQVIQDNFPKEEDEKSEGKKPDSKDQHAEHGGAKKDAGERGEHTMPPEDKFLVTVEYTVPEKGELDGKAYQQALYSITLTGSYSANKKVDESKQLALLYASGGFLTLGVGATLYRRRRIKPFKEVSFDER